MESKTATSEEFERFTRLVDDVLSVPKADVERIKSEPLYKDIRKSQIVSDKTA
jgi:hypothetical protein